MKSIVSIAISFLFYINVSAQETVTTTTLLPDQNPNYQKSRDKYMAESVALTKTEGTTIQQTYKAIDDVQAKNSKCFTPRRFNYLGNWPWNWGFNSIHD